MLALAPISLPKARRPTYYFLQYARRFSTVFLSTDVDMEVVLAHRARMQAEKNLRISFQSYVIQAVSQVIRKYPDANASVGHGLFPRIAYSHRVHAKFTMDKRVDGRRVVVPGLIQDSDTLSLEAIQERVAYLSKGSVETLPEFKGARTLRNLPFGIGQPLYNLALSNLRKRPELQGTFTVTSLGHRPIDNFFPISSSTTCFGIGAIKPTPVALEGQVVVRPRMTLNMAFDHSAVDGALSADLLSDVKDALEAGSMIDSNATQSEGRSSS